MQQWQRLFKQGLPLLTICTIGSAVEFGWAAGEIVLVPYLSKHGVREWVVSTIYLANPTIGMWVQPRLGAWSDRIKRRVPFVIGLSVLAVVGIITLILNSREFDANLNHHDNGNIVEETSLLSSIAIAIAFVGFGTADICFDCLLVPGRALLDDRAVPIGISEEANALFTGFQLCGRLLALLAGSCVNDLGGLYKGMCVCHVCTNDSGSLCKILHSCTLNYLCCFTVI